MGQKDQAQNNPSLRHDTLSEVTWASGNTKTVTDAHVRAGSLIVLMPTSLPAGRWYITVSAGSFIITSSDAESNATFKYRIM